MTHSEMLCPFVRHFISLNILISFFIIIITFDYGKVPNGRLEKLRVGRDIEK